jgi:hypothetical protein
MPFRAIGGGFSLFILADNSNRSQGHCRSSVVPKNDSQVYERLRLASMCKVQIRKTMVPSIDTARGHTTSGARINEVTSPASEQNSSAPMAFRKPASLRKDRCPIAEAARRAATATNPRMRGAIILPLTGRVRSRHETIRHTQNWPESIPSAHFVPILSKPGQRQLFKPDQSIKIKP